MGIDLKLLVCGQGSNRTDLAFTVLNLDLSLVPEVELREKIPVLGPVVRPDITLRSYFRRDERAESDVWGDVTEDAYGEPITYLHAGALAPTLLDARYDETTCAAGAYLAALPPETWVALYWY